MLPSETNESRKKISSSRVSEHPQLAREWAEDLNNGITPSETTLGSSRKIWWRCNKGHAWETAPKNRFRSGKRPLSRCPYCTGRSVMPGFNDLATTHPHMVEEWAEDLNPMLSPQEISAGSTQEVWWRCKLDHTWCASPNGRFHTVDQEQRISGCPYCAGRLVLTGFNDLGTTHPHLAAEWDPDLNPDLGPQSVSAGSTQKVWWRCQAGHKWQARVDNRAISGNECPTCIGRTVVPGRNSVSSYPELMAQWDSERNAPVLPHEVHAGSNLHRWWICPAGHRWKASPKDVWFSITHYKRSGESYTCPECLRGNQYTRPRAIIAISQHRLMQEWDWAQNDNLGLDPWEISEGSELKAWWRCKDHQHSWKATVKSRVHGHRCPICSNKKVLPGYNDLASQNPYLASYWHPTLNEDLKPSMVTCRSTKKVHWLCPKGHHSFGSPAIKTREVRKFPCKQCFDEIEAN